MSAVLVAVCLVGFYCYFTAVYLVSIQVDPAGVATGLMLPFGSSTSADVTFTGAP